MEPTSNYEQIYLNIQDKKKMTLQTLQSANAVENAADFFEYCVDQHDDGICVTSVDTATCYTFKQLDQAANRISHWGIQAGLQQLDTVALLMENRPEFLSWTMGLAKIGVTSALINTNLTGQLLMHALVTSGARLVVVSINKLDNWLSVDEKQLVDDKCPFDRVCWFYGQSDDLQSRLTTKSLHHIHLNASVLDEMSSERPLKTQFRNRVTSRSPLFYIYTSGTTGPSKAAKFSHRRFIGAAVTWAAPSGLKKSDRYYITLPLYHGNAGVVAVAPCYLLGNTIVLRHKFSASNFFSDIRTHNCTAAIYIGELWRYLYSLPPQPNEGTPDFSPLRVAIGNGLRADIWQAVCQRFHIRRIVEHYGSTEMPGDAILNYFNVIGSCGYLPLQVATAKSMTGEGGVLVQYDLENDVVIRNANGHCVPCSFGERGEMIMRLPNGIYDGYVGDVATQRKLYRNVFEVGDTWWSSGDLLKMDSKGFFYFMDRTGDSFRWKGENVSTHDIQVVLGDMPGVKEINAYGIRIPNTDGRAGMVSVVLEDASKALDFEDFTRRVNQLAKYARPLFVRIRTKEHEKTSTLKFHKYVYANQGFDYRNMDGDCVFMANNGKWDQLNEEIVENIQKGKYKF